MRTEFALVVPSSKQLLFLTPPLFLIHWVDYYWQLLIIVITGSAERQIAIIPNGSH
jgi:hypothetical protein